MNSTGRSEMDPSRTKYEVIPNDDPIWGKPETRESLHSRYFDKDQQRFYHLGNQPGIEAYRKMRWKTDGLLAENIADFIADNKERWNLEKVVLGLPVAGHNPKGTTSENPQEEQDRNTQYNITAGNIGIYVVLKDPKFFYNGLLGVIMKTARDQIEADRKKSYDSKEQQGKK